MNGHATRFERPTVIGALVLTSLILLFPPWYDSDSGSGLRLYRGHAFVGTPPTIATSSPSENATSLSRVDTTRLVLYIASVWTLAVLMVYTSRTGSSAPSRKKDEESTRSNSIRVNDNEERARRHSEPFPEPDRHTIALPIGSGTIPEPDAAVETNNVTTEGVRDDHGILRDLVVIAGSYIKRGISRERFEHEMKQKFGPGVSPHLGEAFERARQK